MFPEEIITHKARFTEHQIIAVLKSVEAGRTVKDVCREAGISEASYTRAGLIGFMHDALVCGRRFRTFNVVDDFNREALAIEIDLNIPAQRVVRVLDRIVANRGYPLKLRMDNSPELISLTLAQWAEEHGVVLEFIKPGSQHRMLLSNVLTGRTGQKSWIFICSER